MSKFATREIFLPSKVLELCLKNWDEAEDEALSRAVGEAMEHAYFHLRWLMAVRQHRCRLVVVQLRDARGQELAPHYQIGDLFTLSGWHPERALLEARELIADSGDGLTFDLPVDDEMLADWQELIDMFDLADDDDDAETGPMALLASAMVLLDQAHDAYVDELGDDFYVATRGLEKDVDALVATEFGRWSAETMQVMDTPATTAMAQIFAVVPDGMTTPVPVVFQPEGGVGDEDADEDEDDGR